MDRGYSLFDLLQKAGKNFVCHIKACATKGIIKENYVNQGSYVRQDSFAHLGTAKNRSELSVRIVWYQVEGTKYYVATNRFDLIGSRSRRFINCAVISKHFLDGGNIYHLIASIRYGIAVQMLNCLITYLLMSIHCLENFNEKVSIQNILLISSKTQNELMVMGRNAGGTRSSTTPAIELYAKSSLDTTEKSSHKQ